MSSKPSTSGSIQSPPDRGASAKPKLTGSISPMAKVASAIFGGGTLVVALAVIREGWAIVLIMLVGMALVGCMLLAYRQFVRLWRKRKALPLLRGILSNTSGTLQQISEPARRAKLDDLRRSFEGGISKFRAAGKDIYNLPWYVMVGEAAAGKTEAIRHCSVRFPPGLQDYAQGAGGTINMNWWFLDEAIILDTAGRLMFEEVAPGMSSEWREFLKLLASNRPNCPINGLLLVIPAESLIKDSADIIERKAGRIAQQLDVIQRTLEIRFPVYVVVTKCDLINGFREFFDTLDSKQQQQHQMLGWSNPAALDKTFNPDLVQTHLETVRRRLVRRRYALLLDPVHSEDPDLRRIDEVDALYTFPDSFLHIGPRLKQYMETIFTVGEWSPKPLFLRGIYFTSSMREGSALDAELAEVLKVPVESLQEGRVWQRDKAYFLRDLFVRKVFKEKGLVTRASNSQRLQRRRQLAVIGSATLATLLVAGLTIYGSLQYRRNLGSHLDFWGPIGEHFRDWSIVSTGIGKSEGKPRYLGANTVDTPKSKTVASLLVNVPSDVTAPIDIPPVFRLIAKFVDRGVLDSMRKDAFRAFYETDLVSKAVNATNYKLVSDPAEEWNEKASAALTEFVRLQAEAAIENKKSDPGVSFTPTDPPRINVDRLLQYTLSESDYKSLHADRSNSQDNPSEWIYSPDLAKGAQKWQPGNFHVNGELDAAKSGVGKFYIYWKSRVDNLNSPALDSIAALRRALTDFRHREDVLGAALSHPEKSNSWDGFREVRNDWSEKEVDLEKSRNDVVDTLKAAEDAGYPSNMLLSVFFTQEAKKIDAAATTAFASLTAAAAPIQSQLMIPSAPQHVGAPEENSDLAMDDSLLEQIKYQTDMHRRFEWDARLMAEAKAQLDSSDKNPPGNALSAEKTGKDQLEGVDDDILKAAPFTEVLNRDTSGAVKDIALANWIAAEKLAARARRSLMIDAFLPTTQPTAESIETDIAQAVKTGTVYKPFSCKAAVPMTKLAVDVPYEPKYTPSAAGALLGAWKSSDTWLSADAADTAAVNLDELLKRRKSCQPAASKYLENYRNYWSKTAPSLATVVKGDNEKWGNFFDDGGPTKAAIYSGLQTLIGQCKDAIHYVEPAAATAEDENGLSSANGHLSDNLEQLGKKEYLSKTASILSHWGLTIDPGKSRLEILNLTPSDYEANYLIAGGNELAVVQYWNSLTIQRLRLLNDEWQSQVAKDFDDQIRRHIAFPLVQPGGGFGGTLTPTQFKGVAATIKTFAGNTHLSSSGSSIREGAVLPTDVGGASSLEELRKPYSPDGDSAWFAKEEQIIRLLETPDSSVKFFVMNKDSRQMLIGRNLVPDEAYSDVLFRDATQPANDKIHTMGTNRLVDIPTTDLPLTGDAFPIQYVNDVNLICTEHATGKLIEELKLKGPWPAIDLLFHANTARESPENRRRWQIEVLLRDGRRLWLYEAFDFDLPDKRDWPTLKPAR